MVRAELPVTITKSMPLVLVIVTGQYSVIKMWWPCTARQHHEKRLNGAQLYVTQLHGAQLQM